MSLTLIARDSTSELSSIIFRLSLNHWTAAPAIDTDPSSAYCGLLPSIWYATVLSKPLLEYTISDPVLVSAKQPVPYVFLTSPDDIQFCPNKDAC